MVAKSNHLHSNSLPLNSCALRIILHLCPCISLLVNGLIALHGALLRIRRVYICEALKTILAHSEHSVAMNSYDFHLLIKKNFIHLFGAVGLICWHSGPFSCGTWGISSCSMKTLSCGMWDLVPWPWSKPRASALEREALATGPPGKSVTFLISYPELP